MPPNSYRDAPSFNKNSSPSSPYEQHIIPDIHHDQTLVESREKNNCESDEDDVTGTTQEDNDPSSDIFDNIIASLDFDADPRPSRNTMSPLSSTILLHNDKWLSGKERLLVVHVARFHFGIAQAKGPMRSKIIEAACRLVSYDCGFRKPCKGSQYGKWEAELDSGFANGYERNVLDKSTMGPSKGRVLDKMEAENPGWLHRCYRWAIKMYSPEATWEELAEAMHEASIELKKEQTSGEPQGPTIDIKRTALRSWFKQQGGKTVKHQSRPLLTEDRKLRRMRWCQNRRLENEAGNRYRCFLDEKWFYVVSKRKKAKYLPRGPLEDPGADVLPQRRTMSRRFSSKVQCSLFKHLFGTTFSYSRSGYVLRCHRETGKRTQF